MTNSNSLVRKKIAFALLAALALTLVLGTVGVLLDGIQHRQLETMELNRLMMLRDFEHACRAYARSNLLTPEEELYPRVHHEEMFATLVARDILQYCDGGTWHYIWKWASPDSLDPAKRADEFERRVVADFNANPTLKELIGHRTVRGSEQGYIARPFVVKTDCLGCHGDPKDSSSPAPDRGGAPREQRWTEGKTVAATIFYVPVDDLCAQYAAVCWAILSILAVVAVVLLALSYVLFVKFLKRAAQLVATNRSLESEIADRVRAEASLRTSETKYKTLYDSSRDAILLSTPETGFVGGNPAAIRLFACKDESDLIACTPADVSPERQPDGELSATKAQRMMAIALREGSHGFEWMHKRQDGTEFLTSISMTRMELEGQCLLLGTVRDITDRKRAEAEQTLTTQRMESLLALNHMTDRTMEEIVAAVIEEAIRLTRSEIGYLAHVSEDESVLTMRYWSKSAHAACKIIDKPLIYPVEATGLWGEAVRQRKPIITNDYAAPSPHKRGTPDGHVPITRHMNIPVFDGRRIVAVAGVGNKLADYDERDLRQLQLLMDGWWRIVTKKEFESKLALARDQAEAANQAKSRFLANMSHEIRTPMTAILGYADLLADPLLGPSDRANYAAVIRRSGEHLLTLINDILDLSKIEAGKLSLEMRPCNVPSLLADVAGVVRPRAVQRGIALTVEYSGEFPETIVTDGARLRQAILNLAGNAVKFTEQGSVRIVASFLAQWRGGEPAVRIEVIDTGVGIREEVLPQLFQPFNQGEASISQKFGGTGLGLAISRQIAQLLGGELTANSEWGQGSTFALTVPTGSLEGVAMLRRPGEAERETGEKGGKSSSETLNGIRILLAEDGYDNQRLIRTVLHLAGAEVEVVENGRRAIEKAQNAAFDLILMDINMPEMDGCEATRILRDRGYAQPILALTANAMAGDSDRCLAAGCDAHLSKPINRAELIRTIAAYVGPRASASTKPPEASDETPPGEPLAGEYEPIVSRYADDPDIAKILGGFVERLAGLIDAMRQAIADGRHEELQRAAHKLKGAGGGYGYPLLSEACKTLEDAAKARHVAAEGAALDAVAALAQAIEQGYTAPNLAEATPS